MPKLLQIGDLAKQTVLSIRTLRYYDETGLLIPSHGTEAEYHIECIAKKTLHDFSKLSHCDSWVLPI
ncbi:MAG: MerR family DNA-binding transcriptional regulator [Crocosphaera sp.]|nr:MerR family DNA-binding transcriptional regulator [Crocosphaera sp.]